MGLIVAAGGSVSAVSLNASAGLTAGGEYSPGVPWWSEDPPFFTVTNSSDPGLSLVGLTLELLVESSGNYHFFDTTAADPDPSGYCTPYNPDPGNTITAVSWSAPDGGSLLELTFAPGDFVPGVTHQFGIDIDPYLVGTGSSHSAVHGHDLGTYTEATFVFSDGTNTHSFTDTLVAYPETYSSTGGVAGEEFPTGDDGGDGTDVVPEPATLLLLGGAIVGGIGWRRRGRPGRSR